MEKRKENTHYLTTQKAADILGISRATVANWIKLGKLKGFKDKSRFFIPEEHVRSVKNSLNSSTLLRSRRNKSLSEKNFIPKSYIHKHSPNYKHIKKLIMDLQKRRSGVNISDVLIYYAHILSKEMGVPDKFTEKLMNEILPAKSEKVDADVRYDFGRITSSNPNALSEFLESYPLTYIEGEDTLGMLYISLRRIRDKKSKGAYYTPYYAVDECIENLYSTISDSHAKDVFTILDPACGSGNFLIRLPKEIPLRNIYGCDIDPYSACIARLNLALKYRISTETEANTLLHNIQVMDFLLDKALTANRHDSGKKTEFSAFVPSCGFDILLGNPPWGYSFGAADIKRLKKKYETIPLSGRPESFALFIERGLSVLGNSGRMTYLLPETMLGSDMYLSIRKEILSKSSVTALSYLGDIFDKVQCPCIILSLQKGGCSQSKQKDISVSFYKRMSGLSKIKNFSASGNRLSESSFHILCDNKDYKLIQKINSSGHFTLKDKSEFALGIVTGNNKELLSDEPKPGYEPIAKGRDITPYLVSAPTSYVHFDPVKFQQCADEYYYRAKERLLYRFISPIPVFAYNDTGLVTLNSANILIPKAEGYSALYILCVLNSPVVRYYYINSFKNMKVLRSAIEALPIPLCDRKTMEYISSLAKDNLNAMKQSKQNAKTTMNTSPLSKDFAYFSDINKRIAYLYGLSDEEYRYICEKCR